MCFSRFAFVMVSCAAAIAGCTHDYDGLTTGGPRDTGPDTLPGADGGGDTAPADTLPTDSAPDTAMPDTSPGDVGVDAGPCGAYGLRCCSGTPCTEGACYLGTCVAFAGVYQVGDGGACAVGNPMSGDACNCPPGFVDQGLIGLDATSGDLETLHVCHAPADVVGADFRGAHGRLRGREPEWCEEMCIVDNPFSPDCACPAGTRKITAFGTHYNFPSCRRENDLCVDLGADLVSFGGAFHAFDDGVGAACDDPDVPWVNCINNPITGDCTCPSGFDEVGFSVMRQDLSRYATNPLIACPATFTVCWRFPP